MAGTWVCSILVMFDLWICQIAGCKKENSLITTCVQNQTLNEPDCCAFFWLWSFQVLQSYPWDIEALGLALNGVVSAAVLLLCCCGVWEHEDPLTRTASSCLVCTCCKHRHPPPAPSLEQEHTLTSPRPWGYESVTLIPSICWALKPLQKVPFTSLFRELDLLQ